MPNIPPRVVIDTNVFIRFLLKSPLSKDLFICLEQEKFLLVACEELLRELKLVAENSRLRKLITGKDIEFIEKFLRLNGIFIEIKPTVFACRDPKDNFLLDCAVWGNAEYLVSEDKDLLVLKRFQTIQIFTVKQFLKELYGL